MISRLDRIFVYVSDLKRAERFYGEILGLPGGESFEGDVSFSLGDTELLLVPGRDRGDPRIGADICLWTDDIKSDYGKLVMKGVKFFKPPSRENWGGWLAGMHDSEGNRIFLIQY